MRAWASAVGKGFTPTYFRDPVRKLVHHHIALEVLPRGNTERGGGRRAIYATEVLKAVSNHPHGGGELSHLEWL